MATLLVQLHIYYHDQVDYFIEKMRNITGIDWDLWVTFSEENEETEKKLRAFKPDVKFFKVENIGYDVWPFIHLMQTQDISGYDYVMKLHTKRSMGKCKPNIIMFQGYDWRNALVDGLLYDEDHFRKVISKFEKEPDTGMISSLLTCVTKDYFHPEVRAELTRLGWEKKDKHTCMGTMFMIRRKALELLKNPLINDTLFRNDKPLSGTFFQNAHLYERMLSHLAINSGMKYVTVCPKKKDLVKIKALKSIEPLGKFFFTCGREGRYRQKTVRLFMIKIYQEVANPEYTSEQRK